MHSGQYEQATSTMNDGGINDYSTDQVMTKSYSENPTTIFQSSSPLTEHSHSFSGINLVFQLALKK